MSLLSGLQLLVARFSILCAEACASSTLISTLYCLQLKINLELVSSLVLRDSLLPLLIPLGNCILSDDTLLSHHAFKLLTHIHSTLDSKTMFPLKDIMDKVFMKLNSQSALGRVQAIKFLSYLTHSKPHGELVSILCQQISDQTSTSRLLSLGLLEEIIQGYPVHLLLPHLSNLQEALSLASKDSEEDICLSGRIGTKAFSERFPESASSSSTPYLPHSDTIILEDDGTFGLDTSPTVTSPILFFDSDEDLLPQAPSTSLKRTFSISLSNRCTS
ncbi:CLIP-associating protein 1 [Entomophthora muscae]|uniref:CLIP-associating protein 1 n=1 Tax=Entomophthora muscae TaxID=34485 RepID=A0ACC2U5S4_9FUNG|nr:CLIP-associating protein 1 [Entomophthora muscae]